MAPAQLCSWFTYLSASWNQTWSELSINHVSLCFCTLCISHLNLFLMYYCDKTFMVLLETVWLMWSHLVCLGSYISHGYLGGTIAHHRVPKPSLTSMKNCARTSLCTACLAATFMNGKSPPAICLSCWMSTWTYIPGGGVVEFKDF